MKVKRLNRVELLLPVAEVLDASRAFSKLLGIPIHPPELLDNEVLSGTAWSAGIEFIAPAGPNCVLNGMLARQAPGGAIGPVVWEVEDVKAARAHAEKIGVTPIFEYPQPNGGKQLSLEPADCYGYIATFLDKPGGPSEPAPGSGAHVKRLNRVELLLPGEDVVKATEFFARLLNAPIDPPRHLVDDHVLSAVAWDLGVEIVGPSDETSVLQKMVEEKGGRGGIGPLVWEVEDLDRMKSHVRELGHEIVHEFGGEGRRQIYLSPAGMFGYITAFTQLSA